MLENLSTGADISCSAIGRVVNEFNEPASPDTLRAAVSRIVIHPSLVEGLTGLEPGETAPKATNCSSIRAATRHDPNEEYSRCAAPIAPTPSGLPWQSCWRSPATCWRCAASTRSMARRCLTSSRLETS